ncbi:MlaD family protein [Actinomadura miaoliensis]|uniref:MCE family protein n=1 Tax=Actinomadura miaoliensis TaxID=430685 RepID=A0ABP7W4R2_9ACTN
MIAGARVNAGAWTVTAVCALVAALLTGCSIQTAGAPKGGLTLTATFDDVQGLVTGHSVQMSDVKVGTVTGVRLDKRAFRTTVTMSIRDEYRIPRGTRAEIKVTSLLGENYVDLVLPPGGRTDRGPFLADGAAISDTSVQPSFEQVVGQAGPLLKALASDDVAAVVNAGATALDGNGGKLNTVVAKSGDLLATFARQRAELGRSVDRLARLGRSLAKGSDELERTPAELEKTTRLLNDNKEEILTTVRRLTHLAVQLNDKVLEGRIQKLRKLLRDLDPVLATLAGNRRRLTDLVNGLVTFTQKLPLATYDGQLLIYPLVRVVWPDGTPVIPGLSGNGGNGGSRANGNGDNGTARDGKQPDKQPEKQPEKPENILPDIGELLGGRPR